MLTKCSKEKRKSVLGIEQVFQYKYLQFLQQFRQSIVLNTVIILGITILIHFRIVQTHMKNLARRIKKQFREQFIVVTHVEFGYKH